MTPEAQENKEIQINCTSLKLTTCDTVDTIKKLKWKFREWKKMFANCIKVTLSETSRNLKTQ